MKHAKDIYDDRGTGNVRGTIRRMVRKMRSNNGENVDI